VTVPPPDRAAKPEPASHACHCGGADRAKTPCACPVEAAAAAAVPAAPPAPARNGRHEADSYPTRQGGLPDFAKMDPLQRLAYHRDRLGLGR
jgi:hypothetical protein